MGVPKGSAKWYNGVMKEETRVCPKCGSREKQYGIGKTSAGSRRYRCAICRREYTPNPKKQKYTQSERKEALRLLLLGNSGRAVGKALGMNKSNAYRWAKEAQKKGLSPVDKCRDEN
jgi:transposase-like protein